MAEIQKDMEVLHIVLENFKNKVDRIKVYKDK